ncbi:MAG TPA: hypothetical protein VEH55_10500 [Gaiellaceae bacterium]|jgi:hypothetical protein|nr:hypothetical protein [Gaiellaceae bacterium]
MTPSPQPVTDPTTRDAIFIVLTVNPGDGSRDTVRSACADLPFRTPSGYTLANEWHFVIARVS